MGPLSAPDMCVRGRPCDVLVPLEAPLGLVPEPASAPADEPATSALVAATAGDQARKAAAAAPARGAPDAPAARPLCLAGSLACAGSAQVRRRACVRACA